MGSKSFWNRIPGWLTKGDDMEPNLTPTSDRTLASMTRPFGFYLTGPCAPPVTFDGHLERRLSAMRGQFSDQEAYTRLLVSDPLIYEVYEKRRPEVAGELLHGISIVHAGRIGDEFYMTKGHFHSVRATAEIYYCLRGQGILLMENEEGDSAAETLTPGRVVYASPCWAHRSINTSDTEDLVTFFVYPGHAGHDYSTIEQRGFRKLVLARARGYEIVDNPLWIGAAQER
jgi:glucose-6-phosphate isomerase